MSQQRPCWSLRYLSPHPQQLFYILSVLLNQNISDVSAVKNTANAALPKESFTAKQIVALLSQYGLMSGCDADMLDGKHAAAFALSKHSHALL